MAEPLWRGKTEDRAAPFFDGTCSVIEVHLAEPPGTEVEVWPAGDRTPVTRERLREVIEHAPNRLVVDGDYDEYVDALWALLHGQGDETDGR